MITKTKDIIKFLFRTQFKNINAFSSGHAPPPTRLPKVSEKT